MAKSHEIFGHKKLRTLRQSWRKKEKEQKSKDFHRDRSGKDIPFLWPVFSVSHSLSPGPNTKSTSFIFQSAAKRRKRRRQLRERTTTQRFDFDTPHDPNSWDSAKQISVNAEKIFISNVIVFFPFLWSSFIAVIFLIPFHFAFLKSQRHRKFISNQLKKEINCQTKK